MMNMENIVGRTRKPGPGERTLSHPRLVKELVPSSGWTEDSNGHYLLVDLPDFKKEEVKLQVDTSGHIGVSGERLSSDNKYIMRFVQIFALPPNADADHISGKFDGEILYVTVPKLAKGERKEPEIHNENINGFVAEGNKQESTLHKIDQNVKRENEKQGDDHGSQSYKKEKISEKNSKVDSFGEDFIRKWGKEPSQFERAVKILKRNKGILITALLAFSLGVLASHKFGSDGHGRGNGHDQEAV